LPAFQLLVIHHLSRLNLKFEYYKSLQFVLLCSPKNFGGAYSRRVIRPSVRTYVPNSCPDHNLVIWNRILLFTKMITILRQRVARNFWVATLKVRVTHDLAAKLCPAHNFVISSRIFQLFHRNDHHIEKTCGAQHLGCFYTLSFVCVQSLFGEHHPVQPALVHNFSSLKQKNNVCFIFNLYGYYVSNIETRE
jgi:hypothetical protein